MNQEKQNIMKKEFKGTKVEWHAVEYAGTYFIQDGETHEDNNILDSDIYTEEIVEANARLIAAAPDLLEALQRLLKKTYPNKTFDVGSDHEADVALRAINKALGE